MEQFVITSHHNQPLTGGFVGLLFHELWSSVFAYEHQHVWGLLRASRDVLSARLGTENMSDPVLDQTSHHSLSVREDKMQTVTSGCWLLPLLLLLQKLKTHSNIFVISAITSLPLCASLLCFSHPSASFFLLLPAVAQTLNQRSDNISACNPHRGEKVIRKQDVRATCLWVFTYSGMWIYTEIAFALPNKIRPEVAWDRKEFYV